MLKLKKCFHRTSIHRLPQPRQFLSKCLTAICLTAFLSGCIFPGVFRIDVAQGNLFTQEMLNKLSPGMTREQVRFVMGTPSIEPTLHPDRWDYIYSLSSAGAPPTVYRLSLFFENDTFTHYSGIAPKESELPTSGDDAP